MTNQSIPESCPWTESEQAGKAKQCQGCPNQQLCATAPKGPDPDVFAIKERLAHIKHKILVLSGKGGVGKSTVATNLALALSMNPSVNVGLMDCDITGPSIPRMTGAFGEQIHQSSSGWSPVYVADNLCVVSISFLMENPDDAVIWRGPKKNGLIRQFLRDVDYEDVDYLVIDTPPGTSDEHLSLVSLLKEATVDGAVIVTTPQDVSIADVRRQISFCNKVKLPIVGIIENMSSFVCPKCSHESRVFAPLHGGGEALAQEKNVPFLGRIPLDPRIVSAADEGSSFLDAHPDAAAAIAYKSITKSIVSSLS